MPIDVSQLRPEGLDAAIDFAKTVGCELDPQDVDPMVSLIAKEDDAIVAVVLSTHVPGGACQMHVCLGKLDDPGKLTGELLNKTLMKVHGAGIRRCQISHHGAEETPAHWPGTKWTGQDNPAEEAASSPEKAPDDATSDKVEEKTVVIPASPSGDASKDISGDASGGISGSVPADKPLDKSETSSQGGSEAEAA